MKIVRSSVMTDELREKCISSKKLYLFRWRDKWYESYKGLEKVMGDYETVIYVHTYERTLNKHDIDIFIEEGRLKLVKSLSELYPESVYENSKQLSKYQDG